MEGSDSANGAGADPAKTFSGSEANPAKTFAGSPLPSRFAAAEFRDAILEKLELGLSVQRIFQDLGEDYAYGHSYESVKRYVRTLAPEAHAPPRLRDIPRLALPRPRKRRALKRGPNGGAPSLNPSERDQLTEPPRKPGPSPQTGPAGQPAPQERSAPSAPSPPPTAEFTPDPGP